jgi:hypothetical protein
VKVKTKMNKSAIRSISKNQAKALVMTGQQMLNEVRNDGVMPFDTGNLQNESTYVNGKGATRGSVKISTDAPYARKLYFHPEYNFNTSKNPNARGEWWEDWISGAKMRRPKEIFRAIYRKLGKRYIK